MKNLMRAVPALAVLLVASQPVLAADTPGVVGTWDAVSSTPNGEMPAVITVKQVEGALKAEVELEGAKRLVTDEKLEGDVFRMKVQYDGAVYDVEVKVAGDAFEGTWQGGGYAGTLKARRRP